MFKRYLPNFIKLSSLSIVGWIMTAHFAHASIFGSIMSTAIDTIFGKSMNDFLALVAAWVANMALSITSLWVTLTGALLNVSITMTLEIKNFVDSTSGVYLVWQTIRDISGIFIIFMLLYASFKIILGFDTVGGAGTLIKNIVIAGVLINFSFFITSMLIDASNVVSLALYHGIVDTSQPTKSSTNQYQTDCSQNGKAPGSVNSCVITNQMLDGKQGGMSDIFLTLLKPQAIYNPATAASPSTPSSKPLEIIVQGLVGCIIMFVIGLSFLLASLAFMARLIILILLLAFSPIWFASWVVPGLDDKAKEFTKQLKAQLIFMPVYLLLLYAALEILSSSTVFTNAGTSLSTAGASGALSPNFLKNYIILAINDFFIIFLLNVPLVVAMSMGGLASEWIDTKKYGAHGIWKNVGSYAGRNTGGRLAHIAKNSAVMNKITAWSPSIGNALDKQLGKAANFGFGVKKGGFTDVAAASQKQYEEGYKRISNVDKTRYDNTIKDKDGNTALDRAMAAAKIEAEKYHANTTDTIMSKMMSGASKLAAKPLEIVQKKMGKDSVIGNFAGVTAGNVASAPGTLGMNLGGRKAAEIIAKQKKDDKAIKTSEDATTELNKENLNNLNIKNDIERTLSGLNTSIDTLASAMNNHEKEIAKVSEEIKTAGGAMNGASTATKEATLKTLNTQLEKMKADKVKLEEDKHDQNEMLAEQKRQFAEKSMKLQQQISPGKAIKDARAQNAVIDEVKKFKADFDKGAGNSGGGGAPKPAPDAH